MTLPTIAAQAGAFLIILQMLLMITVGLHRGTKRVFLGLGEGDLDLERKVRRHGNLAENAAIFLVVLALAEILGLSKAVLGPLAVAFVVARLSHAVAFLSNAGSHGVPSPGVFALFRMVGAFGTFLTSVGLGGYLLWSLLTQMKRTQTFRGWVMTGLLVALALTFGRQAFGL